ncbi:MAG: isochorismate synthase [Cyanobacteria bacterium P01_H01_bin.119]
MKIAQTFNNAAQYLLEAFGRIFSPADDQYPDTGVQPFDGEPLSEWINARDI